MTKTEIENKIYDLKRVIESCKNIIKANENEIKKLETEKEKNTFERVEEGKKYYLIGDANGKIIAYSTLDENYELHKRRFENNNYFHTKERAEEVANKINFLLKLERLHDTFCPNYKPDWGNNWSVKNYVLFNNDSGKYISNDAYSVDAYTTVYFDSGETADKVCEILNKELENENEDM